MAGIFIVKLKCLRFIKQYVLVGEIIKVIHVHIEARNAAFSAQHVQLTVVNTKLQTHVNKLRLLT